MVTVRITFFLFFPLHPDTLYPHALRFNRILYTLVKKYNIPLIFKHFKPDRMYTSCVFNNSSNP